VGANGNCNDEDYTAGVCSSSDITKKCDSTYGSSSITLSGSNYIWTCYEKCSGDTATTNDSCSAPKLPTVNGVCGSAETGSSCTAPTTNLCSSGTASGVSTNPTTFTWSCTGSCGGSNDSCTKTKLIINGECGTADGGTFTSTPTTNLCSVGTTSAVTLSGNTYSWSCNRSCNGTIDYCDAVYDTAPTLSSIVLKNTSGTVISADASGRNHTCETAFGDSRTSVWTITATDAQGTTDIKTIDIRFVGVNTYDFEAVTDPVGGEATYAIDTTDWPTGIYDVWYYLEDQHDPPGNTGWLDSGRDFKVWDCQVTIDGTIYDNSTNLPCSNSNENGFTTTIATNIEKFDFGYGALTAGDTKRNMTVVSPGFYSPDKLTWQNNYFLDTLDTSGLPFLGQFRTSKINDVCVAWNINPLSPRNYVSAYDANPTLNIKYSAVMDQEAWFRVNKGSILAETSVKNLVAITCSDNCKTTSQGLVWSKNINLATSDSSRQATNQPQPPKRNYYYTLKYDIYGGKEIGTTYPDDEFDLDLWSRKIGTSNPSGVMFIEGDLIIDQDISASNYAFIIVSGSIIINDNVKTILGTMMYAENEIVASGQSNNQLVITGSLYGKKAVILNRSYTTKRDNNLSPAVEVIYDPNFAFRLPKELWVILKNWRLE